jgi:cyclopropane fatty-acyl-phospholipid synthase-like methyltransferase
MTNEWTKADHAEAYLARMKDIPHRSEGEQTLLSEVPARSKRVLDLGCGNGHLLSMVLAHCPGATGVGLDFSPTMIQQARDRFAGNDRVTLVEHNMDRPLPDLGMFDCVVSSFAIHHCDDARKRQLYGEIWSLLEPEGVFCNLEHVASSSERIHDRFVEAMGLTRGEEDPSNKLLDVQTQLKWLQQIGFEDVDCHWKWRELALIAGRKVVRPAQTESRDDRLQSELFPRTSQYHPDWVITNSMSGCSTLWLTEWLASAMHLKSGMRVLDLASGRAISSIFLAREFGVHVWATDLWISASENIERIRDADVTDRVFPLHADARALPFAAGFFDAIVCVDAFPYFGTDDLYLNYLASFVKPDGQIGIAGAGLTREIESLPDHLRRAWTQDLWALHSASWWRRHWERTGIVDIELADTMPDGWRRWLEWQQTASPGNTFEIEMVSSDQGEYLGCVRVVARRQRDAKLEDYCWPDTMRSFPIDYQKKPLLRGQTP